MASPSRASPGLDPRLAYELQTVNLGSTTTDAANVIKTAVGTFHVFGLANYEVNPQAAPLIGIQPVNKASVPGGGAGFYITTGGARPLSFRWMKDGNEIANQTNRTLILSNLVAGDLAGYSVSVSNGSGIKLFLARNSKTSARVFIPTATRTDFTG